MIEEGKKYRVTEENKVAGTKRSFIAKVRWVEDCGDKWRIGYKPDDIRICEWGVCSIKKEGLYKAINYTFREVKA